MLPETVTLTEGNNDLYCLIPQPLDGSERGDGGGGVGLVKRSVALKESRRKSA